MDNHRLVLIRRLKGYSPENMAKCLNIDVRNYLEKEVGMMPFKLDEIQKILKLLDSKYEDIFAPSLSLKKTTSLINKK